MKYEIGDVFIYNGNKRAIYGEYVVAIGRKYDTYGNPIVKLMRETGTKWDGERWSCPPSYLKLCEFMNRKPDWRI